MEMSTALRSERIEKEFGFLTYEQRRLALIAKRLSARSQLAGHHKNQTLARRKCGKSQLQARFLYEQSIGRALCVAGEVWSDYCALA